MLSEGPDQLNVKTSAGLVRGPQIEVASSICARASVQPERLYDGLHKSINKTEAYPNVLETCCLGVCVKEVLWMLTISLSKKRAHPRSGFNKCVCCSLSGS